mgnify:CR=1 FL=1
MTSIFDENGKNLPCTVIEAGPCIVTQVRSKDVDGYDALQLGFDEKPERKLTKAASGHFKKASTPPKRKLVEFQGFDEEHNLGDTITVDQLLALLVQLHIQRVYSKECAWLAKWAMKK